MPTFKMDRSLLSQRLADDKIFIDWAYDPPLHLQPVYREQLGTSPGMLPVSEEVLSRHICLPMHARLRSADAEYVVDRLLFHAHDLLKIPT
jgi:dTDP-4-amino-4,6-dideoxygalactose transaminase